MSRSEFTLILDRTPTDDDLDALYSAGLDDTTPEYGPRSVPLIHVHRDAESLATAIIGAVREVESVGLSVVGVRSEDLVTLKTIAARTDRTYEGVRRLAGGDRGPGGFPAPTSGDGYALFSWTEVARWFAQHYGMPDPTTEYDRMIAAADHLVRAKRLLGSRAGEFAALAA
ncbi:hypothetical protein [Nocardia callitridis]|uniref:DNA-binding protein n=1 Tax=Nocardia callitridis TaxID=648753 RepID=A0ABP9KTQ4_9NOCA